MENAQFELVFEKYLTASDVNSYCIIFREEVEYFRTMLHPDDRQKLLAGKTIFFLAQDNNNLWRFKCKLNDRNEGKLFGQWNRCVEVNNIVENTLLRFEWAAADKRARLTFQLPIVYGGLQMEPNPITDLIDFENLEPENLEPENLEMLPNPTPIQAMGPNPNEGIGSDSIDSLTALIDFENLEPENLEPENLEPENLEMLPNPTPIQAMGPNPNEGIGSDSTDSLTALIDFGNLEPENLELNAPLNNEAGSGFFEGESLPPQSGAVNSLNQAVSFNTLGDVDMVNMNESNAPLNNEAGSGSFVPTQLGAVNSLNQAVSSNTQEGVDLVNMNERLTKRIKTMQGTIQECLGVIAPCISNIQSETGKMAAALQELEKLLAPYDPSTV
ncbi:uncharacterized protein LOC110685364 [Chenopodium quinoa]|uniref:uncharacterized protein LOC110685364 n=1 Tax=Chenopodium quinoa TaxID=63459 RepID=UPI000B7934FA|nr:uncharacterized protein LOC110685364 [Chenopodium quinoa]XP_021717580.1 uncharacterized protein LOC110685364 [Chenopodium quinoa]